MAVEVGVGVGVAVAPLQPLPPPPPQWPPPPLLLLLLLSDPRRHSQVRPSDRRYRRSSDLIKVLVRTNHHCT